MRVIFRPPGQWTCISLPQVPLRDNASRAISERRAPHQPNSDRNSNDRPHSYVPRRPRNRQRRRTVLSKSEDLPVGAETYYSSSEPGPSIVRVRATLEAALDPGDQLVD